MDYSMYTQPLIFSISANAVILSHQVCLKKQKDYMDALIRMQTEFERWKEKANVSK